ncbi:MAG: hypothetical protein JWN85_4729 [Gammaproteobacteria bacterium]|nr:hypothetical protein [Gammaproteobacteria bacterium]
MAGMSLKLSGETDGTLQLRRQEGLALARVQVLGSLGGRAVLADTVAP